MTEYCSPRRAASAAPLSSPTKCRVLSTRGTITSNAKPDSASVFGAPGNRTIESSRTLSAAIIIASLCPAGKLLERRRFVTLIDRRLGVAGVHVEVTQVRHGVPRGHVHLQCARETGPGLVAPPKPIQHRAERVVRGRRLRRHEH